MRGRRTLNDLTWDVVDRVSSGGCVFEGEVEVDIAAV